MGRYYNRGRGNLALTLSGGRSFSVPGNTWFELEGSDETQASVMKAVRKGQLFRQPTPPQEEPKADQPSEVKVSASPAEEEAKASTADDSPKPRRAAPSART